MTESLLVINIAGLIHRLRAFNLLSLSYLAIVANRSVSAKHRNPPLCTARQVFASREPYFYGRTTAKTSPYK